MRGDMYIAGVMDTLVKAGAVSPEYASGVLDTFVKKADWSLLPDSPFQNYWEEIQSTADKAIGSSRKYMSPAQLAEARQRAISSMSPEQQLEIIARSRHWYDNGFSRAGNYLSNRFNRYIANPIGRFLGTSNRTASSYDHELAHNRAKELEAYQARELDPMLKMMGVVRAGAQERANDVENLYRTDTRYYMSDAKRRQLGYNKNPSDVYRSDVTDSAIAGGMYKPKHDYGRKATVSRLGGFGTGPRDAFGNRVVRNDSSDLEYSRPFQM